MKTKLLLGFWLLLGVNYVTAHPKRADKPVKLISSEGVMYMNAEWSPNGQKIAFTSEKYNGLWVCNNKGQKIEKLTSDSNAGFAYKWSADSKSILARPVILENSIRFHQVVFYSVENRDKTMLIGKTRNLKSLPIWVDGDSRVAVLTDKGIKEIDTGKQVLKGQDKNDEIKSFKSNLVKGNFVVECRIPEFKDRYVYNLVQSPDGSKMVFQVNGLGLYVANIDGSGLKQLGYGEQASWMPDGKYVVVTNVKDNGDVLTSGEIEAVNVTSGEIHSLLADSGFIALNPSVSPDGKSILFDNALDGAIYVMEVK